MSEHLSAVLRRKLERLRLAEAKATDAGELFKLAEEIKEVTAKLADLGDLDVRGDLAGVVQESPQRIAASKLPQAASELFGREDELAALDEAWQDPGINVVTLVAFGGVGKTSLVGTWMSQLAMGDFDGADYFDWSFYSQGTRDQGSVSADSFIDQALRFFGDVAMAESTSSPWNKGERLAALIGTRRTLLVLDGLEPLQYAEPQRGELKDDGVRALLRGLAARNVGLCVVTTRESVKDLSQFRSATAPEWKLGRLGTVAGIALLEKLDVHGPRSELEALVSEVRGHALTLNIVGQFLKDAHGGDVRRRDVIDFHEADDETQDGHAFRAMAAYESWLASSGEKGKRQLAILHLLGLFDRPADAEYLAVLRRPPAIAGLTEAIVSLREASWNLSVSRLVGAGLLLRDGDNLDAHPLVRGHFTRRLEEQSPKAAKEAHGRLFDYLKDNTEHHPDTLEALQPLYQAVVHGCRAGRHQEACDDVYQGRINRGTENDGFYSTKKLGAFSADLGAIACFFDEPWNRVSQELSEAAQAWLYNAAAFCLRALGRLREAVEPMRVTLRINSEQGEWKNAAAVASNLSELELSLGDVVTAVRDAEQSVDFADRSGDAFLRMGFRTTLADALHHTGLLDEALEVFTEAESIQAKRQPHYPRLYSLQGFRFCDLLLADAERAAASAGGDIEALRERLDDIELRAAQALELAVKNNRSLLSIALDHLTLGRLRLYRALLDGASASLAESEIEQAVDGLRRAGNRPRLPLGLLTRAWLRFAQDRWDDARADLDAAEQIARRGPMPLFLADIALYRARFFQDREALAEARRLVDLHGYGRRLEEVAALEVASAGWPMASRDSMASEVSDGQ